MAKQPVVSVEDLHVRFVMRDATVAAVNGVSFDLEAGKVLGILGESGSGKSVTLRALMRPVAAGAHAHRGADPRRRPRDHRDGRGGPARGARHARSR